MLADVFHIGGLRKELVDLVADVELLEVLEVVTCQLLLDAGKNLNRTGILCLASFGWDAFLGIEDTALENGWAASREVARLHTVVGVDAFDHGLATFGVERHSVGGFLGAETPVDQGIVNELNHS